MSASSKKKLRKEQNAVQMTEKQQQEQRESKKLKIYSITFIVVLAVVVCLAIGIAGTTAFVNSGILERNTAALTVGEHTLNSVELGYYYMDSINSKYDEWYSTYGDMMSLYLSISGLDVTKPLNKQPCNLLSDGKTWADYFADLAVTNATANYALYDEALKNNFTMTDEIRSDVESALAGITFTAMSNGFTDSTAYLKAQYGNGTTLDSFKQYLEVSALVNAYLQETYDGLSYTDDDLTAYDKEHHDEYTAYSYSVFPLNREVFVDCPASEDDTDHVHSEEEYTAAVKAAEKAAQTLVDSEATTAEELNAQIAKLDAYKDNTSTKCAEYDSVLYSSISDKNIAEWLNSSVHKSGDMTVIPSTSTTTNESGEETTTTNGYYVVMFHEKNENDMKLANVRHILVAFQGGTTDSITGQTVYSDDTIAAAKVEIEAIKDEWLSGETVDADSFAAMAEKHSDDTGSSSNGGLYEDVYPGQMVEAFNDWCFDKSRKAGDYDIVQTEYGFHLIYFVGNSDTTFREYMIENTLRDTDFSEWYSKVIDSAVSTVHTISRLDLDKVLGA